MFINPHLRKGVRISSLFGNADLPHLLLSGFMPGKDRRNADVGSTKEETGIHPCSSRVFLREYTARWGKQKKQNLCKNIRDSLIANLGYFILFYINLLLVFVLRSIFFKHFLNFHHHAGSLVYNFINRRHCSCY